MLPWKPTSHQVNILYNIEKTLLFCILVHKEPPARKASLSIKHFGCYIKRKEELTPQRVESTLIILKEKQKKL